VALSKLGIEPGSTGVLHTWTRQLIFHLHIHYLVPGGGLTPNGLRWKRVADSQFFLPQAALAARFKNRLRQWLQAEHQEQLKQIPRVLDLKRPHLSRMEMKKLALSEAQFIVHSEILFEQSGGSNRVSRLENDRQPSPYTWSNSL
jgi:hypothetical protein